MIGSLFRYARTLRRATWKSPPKRLGVGLLLLAALPWLACGGSPQQRRQSIYDLQADPTPDNVDRIRALLADADPQVRATALNSLVGLGVPDADALVGRGVADPDGFVRLIAAKRAGDLHAIGHVDALARMVLEDADGGARKTAAEALGILGGPRAAEALVRALDDPVGDVRLAAAKAIQTLDPALAAPRFAKLLETDPMWEVRAQAAAALGGLGDARHVPALRAALGDTHPSVRAAVASALARLGQPVPGRAATAPPFP